MSIKELSTQTLMPTGAGNFQKELAEALQSSLSLETIHRPVSLVPCGHAIDSLALPSLFSPHEPPGLQQPCEALAKTCPICRETITMYIRNPMLETIAEIFRTNMGCPEPVFAQPVAEESPTRSAAEIPPIRRRRHIGPLPEYIPQPIPPVIAMDQ